MNKQDANLFEIMRKPPTTFSGKKQVEAVFFQLDFDENGAFIRVIDNYQKEVDPDYRYFSGPTRDVLKSIEYIREKSSFNINWIAPNGNIYLSENEIIIWQLKKCKNFISTHHNPIQFVEGRGQIIIRIEGNSHLTCSIFLHHEGKEITGIKFLNGSFVHNRNRIYEIVPLGDKYSLLKYFATHLVVHDLEKYLSLLFSCFDNIHVDYSGYQQIDGPLKQTQPTVIFEKIDRDQTLYLRVTSSLSVFEVDFFENYDIRKIALTNDMENTIAVSDVARVEIYPYLQEINKLLQQYKKQLKKDNEFIIDKNVFIIEESLAKVFLYYELANLLTHYVVYGAEKLRTYKVRTVMPQLRLSIQHNIDFLEGDASLEIEGESFSLFDALQLYRKNAYIPLSDGTHAVINRAYIAKLERIFKKQHDKVRLSFFDLPIVEELIDEKVASECFKQSRNIFLGFNQLKDKEIPLPEINATLRPYQRQGYTWLDYLHQHGLGGCLADDMGLGKTLQTLTILATVYPGEKLSSLVVMPKSLLFNWENEIRKFTPRLSYYIYYGNQRDLSQACEYELILTTYALVRNDIEKFKEQEFYYVILDESQNIKNLASQIAMATMLLNCRHRLALSGTPIQNNLVELYTLFRFLNPPMFGSVDDFNRHYTIPIQQDNNKEAVRELKKKVYPFILRRLKKDVLQDLPEKIEHIHYIEMTDVQKSFYESRRQFYYKMVKQEIAVQGIKKSQFLLLQALSELRQIACIPEAKSDGQIISPKREVLVENILDATANGHKVLVYANFLSVLDYVSQDLENIGLHYLLMTGATMARKTLVDKFQNDPGYPVFLMTLKTGGLGLNLTAADTIFIFDPWWNKAAENQAVDRTHRIGQDKTVFSYKLITRDSIEEKILLLQQKKSELFESIITSDDASIKSLDEQDVEYILGNDNV